MKPIRPIAAFLLFAFVFAALSPAQRRKKKQDEEPIPTQVLEVLPEPPNTITVDPARLSFITAPLSNKGLLSQQVRDGVKALLAAARGAQIVKIRAFVAGTGDLRRVQSVVADVLVDKKLAMPVVSTILVGGLPLEGAQVLLEATLIEKKPAHENGLAFLSGQLVTSEEPVARVKPLAEKSLEQLRRAAEAAGSTAAGVLRVTCFVTSLEDAGDVRALIAATFARAQASVLQTQRGPTQSLCECEGMAHLDRAPAAPLQFLNPEGLTQSPNYSQVAVVRAPALVLSTIQLAFRYTEDDARLAFQRLDKMLAGANSSLKRVAMMNTYSLSSQLTETVRKVRFDYLNKAAPPASTLLLFEGLPSMDAAFGIEVAALPER